jgi:hypothetical protein
MRGKVWLSTSEFKTSVEMWFLTIYSTELLLHGNFFLELSFWEVSFWQGGF